MILRTTISLRWPKKLTDTARFDSLCRDRDGNSRCYAFCSAIQRWHHLQIPDLCYLTRLLHFLQWFWPSDLALATNCVSDISIQAIGQLNKEYPDWLTEFQAW